jgi:hypothetical protein
MRRWITLRLILERQDGCSGLEWFGSGQVQVDSSCEVKNGDKEFH